MKKPLVMDLELPAEVLDGHGQSIREEATGVYLVYITAGGDYVRVRAGNWEKAVAVDIAYSTLGGEGEYGQTD